MDVAAAQVEAGPFKDEVAERCQKKFQPKYLEPAKELVKPERNTLDVSMRDIERHNNMLAETNTKEYYRVYPHLCAVVKKFGKDQVDQAVADKDFYLSLTEMDVSHKVCMKPLS